MLRDSCIGLLPNLENASVTQEAARAATALGHQRQLFSFNQAGPTLDQPHLRGFWPLAALGDIEENAISFAEAR